jgi:hypothetical protein
MVAQTRSKGRGSFYTHASHSWQDVLGRGDRAGLGGVHALASALRGRAVRPAHMLCRPQLHLYHALMRDYEESPLMMEDDFDDLNDDPNEDHSD